MTTEQQIERFFASPAFGVVGASNNREKYGNKVLRCYQRHHHRAIPVNPREKRIEGEICVASLNELPSEVNSISVITPPHVTENVVTEAAARGIQNVWMQPGSESPTAVSYCHEQGLNVIADGSCLLVHLGCH